MLHWCKDARSTNIGRGGASHCVKSQGNKSHLQHLLQLPRKRRVFVFLLERGFPHLQRVHLVLELVYRQIWKAFLNLLPLERECVENSQESSHFLRAPDVSGRLNSLFEHQIILIIALSWSLRRNLLRVELPVVPLLSLFQLDELREGLFLSGAPLVVVSLFHKRGVWLG